MKTKDLIAEATSLPVEERALLVDTLLKSLNPVEEDIDRKWAAVAKRRLEELESGKVKAVPGDEVYNKMMGRFSR
ncbi:MAG: addiction module protein [Nitrospirae bacterium]|nr:addiction module protein [Nitrospirota bacterium]MBI5695343.1 addiction module protein [Nitrospirota bacterium]